MKFSITVQLRFYATGQLWTAAEKKLLYKRSEKALGMQQNFSKHPNLPA
jgi:hypothetical protein